MKFTSLSHALACMDRFNSINNAQKGGIKENNFISKIDLGCVGICCNFTSLGFMIVKQLCHNVYVNKSIFDRAKTTTTRLELAIF